jgi:hypothetical protein
MSDTWTTIAAERGGMAAAACDDLTGPGVPTLRGRCAPNP